MNYGEKTMSVLKFHQLPMLPHVQSRFCKWHSIETHIFMVLLKVYNFWLALNLH